MSNLFRSPHAKKTVYILICTLLPITIIWFVFTVEFVSWDFRNELWAPSYLLWHRESAYNTTILFPISLAVWFPQIIGVFFPLGLLSQYQAANLWLIINITLIIYLTWFLTAQVKKGRPKPLLFSILLIGFFLFPPTFRLLVLGQVDIIIMSALIAGMHALKQRRPTLAAFLYALALAKPQLAVVVLPSLVGYLLFIKKDWRSTAGLILTICFFIAALTIPLWISNPKWIYDFISNLSQNPQWLHPSIFFQLHSRMGPAGIIVWSILYVSVLITSLRFWQKLGSSYAILWSIALTTIVSPYIWSWDFTLLLPLFIDTATRLTTNMARFVLFSFYILSLIFSVISLQSVNNAGDDVLWWFPIMIMIGVILSLWLDKKSRISILDGAEST